MAHIMARLAATPFSVLKPAKTYFIKIAASELTHNILPSSSQRNWILQEGRLPLGPIVKSNTLMEHTHVAFLPIIQSMRCCMALPFSFPVLINPYRLDYRPQINSPPTTPTQADFSVREGLNKSWQKTLSFSNCTQLNPENLQHPPHHVKFTLSRLLKGTVYFQTFICSFSASEAKQKP